MVRFRKDPRLRTIRDAWISWSSMDPPPVEYPVRSALGSFQQEGRNSLRIRFSGINSRISVRVDDYGEFWFEVSFTDQSTTQKQVQRIDQIGGIGGQRRRSRVTRRFLERFVFPDIASIVNRFVVIDHVVIMDNGWILFARNDPKSGTPVFMCWKDHTWQRFDPHCEQYNDDWRSYCENQFDLSRAREFIPIDRSFSRPTTPCVIDNA